MLAKKILKEENYSCVVVKDNELKHAVIGHGIKPLLMLYKETPEDIEGSFVADKLIGRAAASILICARVKEAYGEVASRQAVELLEKYNIKIEYNILVEEIRNKDDSDMCPLEKLVQKISNPVGAVKAIEEFLK